MRLEIVALLLLTFLANQRALNERSINLCYYFITGLCPDQSTLEVLHTKPKQKTCIFMDCAAYREAVESGPYHSLQPHSKQLHFEIFPL